jgi:23S rRNA pseudouridine2605 synthase
VTTADDPQGRTTVVQLVEDLVDVRVYPVGRLDLETSGLLVLTNDGELAHRLMHPSFGVDKTYRAMVTGAPTKQALAKLREGVELEDGTTSPAKVRLMQEGQSASLIELTIHEGKNRQVRRMFDAIGHPVRNLTRVAYGPLTLGNLKPGDARELSVQEIRKLKKVAGLNQPRRRQGEQPSE